MAKLPKYLRLLLLVTATMPLWDLGHPLWEVDDARYAEVPREMVETGDWITPHLDGVDYIQKPPLIYWLTAGSYKIFGVSEASSRAPLFLLALLGLLGVLWSGSQFFSIETGAWAAVILGSGCEFSILSHLQTPDLALTVCLLWATGLMLKTLMDPERAAWSAPAAGLALGLAFLAKGLVAWLLPALWACALFALLPETRKGLRWMPMLSATLVALATAGPWLWAISSRHPRFLEHFFIEQHFRRFLTKQYNRPGPWYYFLGIDAAGLLPWTPLVLGALAVAAARWKRLDSPIRALALWVGLVLAFFSASHSKLPTYILPAFPQQCLIGAWLVERLGSGKEKLPWLDRLHQGLGISLCVAAAVAAAVVLAGLVARLLPLPKPLILTMLAATLGIGIGWITPKLLPWSAFFLTESLLIGAHLAEPQLSARSIAREVSERCPAEAPLVAYNIYLQGLPFYTHRRVDLFVNWVGEFDYEQADARYRSLFGDDDHIRAMGRSRRPACVIVEKKQENYFASLVPSDHLRFARPAGGGPWVLALLGTAGR